MQSDPCMNPEAWREIKPAFQGAVELAPADRRTYLEALPDAVRREVASLLRAYEQNSTLSAALDPDASDPTSPVDRELVGRQFGPYGVLSLLGEGGMGTVWLAERVDRLFTRRVALKLVHPALMGHVMTERVAREREILASLNHPNIAKLFDAGFAEDGQPYLALEYVSGTPLTSYCDERALSVNERLALFRQVLSAVQYAHAHLVIHRDLKPSNILVSEDGQAHLLDFGVAKFLTQGEARETQLTRLAGRPLTPDYAAPEQIAGTPITTAADIYALGVMLYELLTGERPYRPKRDSAGALEEAILQAEPVAPSRLSLSEGAARARGTSARRLARSLKGDLDTITSKALKKSPGERYATANAFDEDIARFLSGEAVLAQPDSLIYRVRKFVGRHRVAIAGVSVLFLTLAAGLVATTYEAHIASAQRDAALQAQQSSLTQTAAARLKDNDVTGAMAIVLEVLTHRRGTPTYPTDALTVFQEARAADAQVLAIIGHTDLVGGAAFSADGRRIVSASFDQTARVWDAMSGQQLLLLKGHTSEVRSAAFSPDGRRILTAGYDKTARVWDAISGEPLLVLKGHTDRLKSAAFSPDGRLIATASHDKTARLWDAVSGQQLRVLSGHTERLTNAVFSPDGARLATASWDHTARLWDVASGQPLRVLSGHPDGVDSATFSPDGQRIVTAAEDKTARVWDSMSGQTLLILSGHTAYVDSAAFSPDGRSVVTASADGTARLWDAMRGQRLRVLSGHTGLIVSVAFSPDGRNLVTASQDRTVRVWDAVSPRQQRALTVPENAVVSGAFSPDGRQIVTADNRLARLWDAASGQQLRVFTGHTDFVDRAAFSPDGRRIVTASSDGTARVWDAVSGEALQVLRGHTNRVVCAAFSPDGRHIVSASSDNTARLWDAESGRQLLVLSGHAAEVGHAWFSPDGRRVVTTSEDRTARLWDTATGQQMLVLSGHSAAVLGGAFSPDGRRIATASADKTARVWDATSGQQLLVLDGRDMVSTPAFSPDGRHIVAASKDGTARIWDAVSGDPLLVLAGHTNRVVDVAFSPDGQQIITASLDGTARIWDARVAPLDTQLSWANAAQFEPLSRNERSQLGLPQPSDVRRWPSDTSKCDQAAAAPYDPSRRAPGVTLDHLVAGIASPACAGETANSASAARVIYQEGRALMAEGDFAGARRSFERALAANYRAAGVDLGMLLSQPAARMLDVQRAVSLYERAWTDGVLAAAFELGDLYEHGVHQPGNNPGYVLAPDEARAWSWYQKGAAAGEPNALGRSADKEARVAIAAGNMAKRNAQLLQAFKYYAAAAERARLEDWPDEAWKGWRYHRASLARVLERQGMMQQVADAYEAVRRQYAPSPSTLRERLTSFLGIN